MESTHTRGDDYSACEASNLPALLEMGTEEELLPRELADLLQVGLQVDDVPAKPLAQVVDGVLGRVLLGVELEDSVGTN